MNEVNVNKKIINILSVAFTISIVLAIFGFSYGYFAVIINRGSNSSILIGAAGLEISYDEDNTISALSVIPGWSSTKTFSIANSGNEAVAYSLFWSNVTNTVINKSYLVYTISSTGTGAPSTVAPVQFPSTSGEFIFTDVYLGVDVTHSFQMTVSYLNDPNYDQSSDMSMTFAAAFELSSSEIDTTLLNSTSRNAI